MLFVRLLRFCLWLSVGLFTDLAEGKKLSIRMIGGLGMGEVIVMGYD